MHPDPEQLRAWRDAIAGFLKQALGLTLKDAGRLAPVSAGADFLGYIVRPRYRLVRRRVLGHARDRLRQFGQRVARPLDGGVQQRLTRPARERLRATLASTLGHGRHAAFANAWRRLWQSQPWLAEWFDGPPPPSAAPRLTGAGVAGRALNGVAGLNPRWEPARVTSLRSQWRFFHRQGDGLTLLQVGHDVEAYGADADRLRALRPHARPAVRPGFDPVFRRPLKDLAGLRRQLRRRRIAHRFIAEEGYLRGGLKRRVLRLTWRPGPLRRPGPCPAPPDHPSPLPGVTP